MNKVKRTVKVWDIVWQDDAMPVPGLRATEFIHRYYKRPAHPMPPQALAEWYFGGKIKSCKSLARNYK